MTRFENVRLSRYYLPAGDRAVYALLTGKSSSTLNPRAVDAAGTELPVECSDAGKHPHYATLVVVDGPAVALELVGPQPQRTTGYRLREPELESAALPATITEERWAELSDDTDDAVNMWRYEAIREPDPESEPELARFELDACQPIPVEWAEAPEIPAGLRWEPSPAHVAIWGPALAPHLVPGTLHGVTIAVLDAVAEHPWVRPWGTTISRHPLLTHDGKVTFYFDRRFEGDMTEVVKVKPSPRSRKLVDRVKLKLVTEWVRDVKPPADTIPGVNLADALANLATFQRAEVERILPHEGHVCSHCGGAGYLIP